MTRVLAILALLASAAADLAGPAEAHDPAPTPTPASGWTVVSLADGALDVVVVSLLVPR